jgi:hypothetical protein
MDMATTVGLAPLELPINAASSMYRALTTLPQNPMLAPSKTPATQRKLLGTGGLPMIPMPTISVSHKVDKGDGAATNFKMDVPYDMWASMDKDLLKRLGFGPMPWESVKW